VKAKVEPEPVRIGDTATGGSEGPAAAATTSSEKVAALTTSEEAADTVTASAEAAAEQPVDERDPAANKAAAAESEAADEKVAAESEASGAEPATEPEVAATSDADLEQPVEAENPTAGQIIVAGVPVAEGPAALDEVTTANAVPDAAEDDADDNEVADPADVAAAGGKPADVQPNGERARPRREAPDVESGDSSAEPRDADWSEASVR
jgi:hypothetical protein